MKSKKFIIKSVLLVLLMVSFSSLSAQNNVNPYDGMTINEQLKFELDESRSNEIQSKYVVDISALDFSSEEMLTAFCSNFSFDFQTLEGNYAAKQITVLLNIETLSERGLDAGDLNDHFSMISARMAYLFNKLKESAP